MLSTGRVSAASVEATRNSAGAEPLLPPYLPAKKGIAKDLATKLRNGANMTRVGDEARARSKGNEGAPTSSFYMRPLPENLWAFDSKLGKTCFREALSQGTLESYFVLAQQFLTQNEPAFCGVGTLCMILNALRVDPYKTWKGSWRWFEQDMLSCCRSSDHIKEHGITLDEFHCLSKCYGLEGETKYASDITLDEFRRDVERTSRHADEILAVSFSRKALGQTGSGHFSPIGGYSAEHDRVLVLDVARFKYPSYWVKVEELWLSMQPLDESTGQSRGYSILTRQQATSRTRPSTSPSATARGDGTLNLSVRINRNLWREMQRWARQDGTGDVLARQIEALPVFPVHQAQPQVEHESAMRLTREQMLSILVHAVLRVVSAKAKPVATEDTVTESLGGDIVEATVHRAGEQALVEELEALDKCCAENGSDSQCQCMSP